MAKGWATRLRRGRLGWLGRIDGVEKPALLMGIGLVLYRVWRSGDPGRASASRWRTAVARVRQQIGHRFGRRRADPSESPPSNDRLHDPPRPL
jgi:hypothetical protein